MQGTYEYTRDNHRLPACWKTENDACEPHFHSNIEVLYVLKGQIRAALNGRPALVGEGEFLISPSYTVHYYQTEAYSYAYVLTIPTEAIPSYKSFLSKKTFANCCCKDRSGGEMRHCLEALNRLTLEGEEESIRRLNTIKGYVYVLFGLMLEESGVQDVSENQNTSLAKDILTYLQAHYQGDLTLEALAQTFGYSKSRFSHLFHEYFGSGISEYVNTLRCKAAAEALARHEVSMVEIAMGVGFESARTFYRAFKRCYGMTPSQYASRHTAGKVYRPGAAGGKSIFG